MSTLSRPSFANHLTIKAKTLKFWRKLILMTCSAMISTFTYAQTLDEITTSDLFREALQVKSSNIGRSDQLIEELERRSYLFDRESEEQLFYLKAYQQLVKGNPEEAIRFHEKVIYSDNLERRIRAYNNILYIDIQLNYFSIASESIQPIIDILATDKVSPRMKIESHITLAYAYNNLGFYDGALEHLGTIDLIDKSYVSGRYLCFINSQKVNALYGLQDFTNGDTLAAETRKICQQEGETFIIHRLINEQAKVLVKQQRFKTALTLMNTYEKDIAQNNFPLNNLLFNSVAATVHSKLNNLNKAAVYANKTLTYKDKYPNRAETVSAAKVLYNIEKLSNNIDDMFALQKQIVELEQQYVSNEQQKIIALNRIEQDLSSLKWTISDYQLSIETETKTHQLKQATIAQVENVLFLEQSANLILIGLIILIYKYIYKALLEKKDNQRALQFQKDSNYPFRKKFFSECKAALKAAELQNTRCSLIVLNIDNFRTINELQGNDRADRLILLFYEQFDVFIPQGSLIGCLGGDEFAFLIPDCPVRKAEAIAERFRLAINYLDTRKVSYQFDVTASFGVTDSLISSYQFEQILMDAEKALSQAKQEYKNCVCRYIHAPSEAMNKIEKQLAISS